MRGSRADTAGPDTTRRPKMETPTYKKGDPQPKAEDFTKRADFTRASNAWWDAQQEPKQSKTAKDPATMTLDDMPASLKKVPLAKRTQTLRTYAKHFDNYAKAFKRFVELSEAEDKVREAAA